MNEETKRGKVVVNLPVRELHPHPKNPRKDLGDLEELTDSIKKNGIMQNLTVIPGFYRANGEWFNTDVEYTVIIGHRRLEAAKRAGLTEVPCRIYKNLPESEQITTMLEENMQRNDLTPYEQGQSFQLCLDLGETVDTLVKKTGFAKSTIYHRINIAKLDQEYLKELDEDDSFQLTIADLIELEKIKDIDTRNRILKEARSSNDLRFKADQTAKTEKRESLEADAEAMCKERGMAAGETSDRWSGKYEIIYRHNMAENDYTNNFIIPPEIEEQIDEGTKYLISYGEVTLLNPKTKTNEAAGEEDDEEEKEPDWEKQRKERDKRNASYNSIRDPLKQKTHDFVMNIITGKLDDIGDKEIPGYSEAMLNVIMQYDMGTNHLCWEDLIEFITGIDKWDFDEEEEFFDKVREYEKLPLHHKLLAAMAITLNKWSPIRYDGTYVYEVGKLLMQGYDILERWDWTYTDDEKLLLNGNHDLYVEEEEDEEDEN